MDSILLENGTVVRLGALFGMLSTMAVFEMAVPRRRQKIPRLFRWTNNLGLVVLDTLLVRLTFPVLAVGLATMADERGWGFFNVVETPTWFAVVCSMFALDLVIYLQHVVFHAVPVLWRLHRVHHADLEFDVTTGLRFHPIEILLSMLIKLGVVAALGPPAVAVLIFEVVLNAGALFNHGNVRLPSNMDRVLRFFVVTPDMHRIHHSVIPDETNSNFGFNLSCWDRLLGTYRNQPRCRHEDMSIGIEDFRTIRDLRLDQMLIQPFRMQTSTSTTDIRSKEQGA